MAPEAVTVSADNWSEVTEHLAKTGFFEDGQMSPDLVTHKVLDCVKGYTTVIGYWEDGPVPIGSGTFVRLSDGQSGVLTAGHVIGKLESHRIIGLTQGIERITWEGFAHRGMTGEGKDNKGPKGPDLGWIPLSPELAQRLEGDSAVFYNRAKKRTVFSGPRCDFRVVLGFVNEASRPERKEISFHGIFSTRVRECGPDEDGWDTADYSIEYVGPGCPLTHGGVSGSGAWRIEMPYDGTGQKEVTLEGVVFAEGEEHDRKLIAHGEASLRSFLDRLEGS